MVTGEADLMAVRSVAKVAGSGWSGRRAATVHFNLKRCSVNPFFVAGGGTTTSSSSSNVHVPLVHWAG